MKKIHLDMSNAITRAVYPVKAEAAERAKVEGQKVIDRVISEMEKANWNLDIAAPRPRSFGPQYPGKLKYHQMRATHDLYSRLTAAAYVSRSMDAPDMRKRSEEAEARFIKQCVEMAEAQYDLFVLKLCAKIGDVVLATLSGSHVWGYSFLKVTKPDCSEETWKTQQIVNYSKFGMPFNQWPSRKVK